MWNTEQVAAGTNAGSRLSSNVVVRQAYLAAVIASGGVVLAASATELVSAPFPPMWLVLALLTLVTGWATVRMPGFPISLSLSDTFTMAAALLFGPAAGALLAGADGLVMSMGLARESRTPTRVLFNMAAAALAMWSAASLFFWLVTPPAPIGRIVLPLALFGGVYFVLNTGLVAGAVAIGRRLPVHLVWRDHFLPLWLTYCVGTSFAGLLLVSSAAGLATLQTLVVALPVVFIASMGLKRGVDHLRERSAQHAVLRSYAFALRSTADAVLLTNADGRVTFMNAMAERLTGWTEAAARGRPVEEVFRPQPSRQRRGRQQPCHGGRRARGVHARAQGRHDLPDRRDARVHPRRGRADRRRDQDLPRHHAAACGRTGTPRPPSAGAGGARGRRQCEPGKG